MNRNVTIRMKEDILKKCRFAAVEEDLSLSKLIAVQLEHIICHRENQEKARIRAIRRLNNGFHLNGKPVERTTLHDRNKSVC